MNQPEERGTVNPSPAASLPSQQLPNTHTRNVTRDQSHVARVTTACGNALQRFAAHPAPQVAAHALGAYGGALPCVLGGFA